jgi:phytoene dehydrogenase-like protein
MATTHDIVFVGAGHNNLTVAGYLAKAGKDVLLLEANEFYGSGCVTQELNAPGFKHDTHSTLHWLIQPNPLIREDELDLQSKFGLKYIRSPMASAALFPDRTALYGYSDTDRTCEQIAKFSEKDADAYRRFSDLAKQTMPMLVQGMYAPPAPFGSFVSLLDQSPEGRTLLRNLQRSIYDMVMEMFEHPKVQMHLLKFASELAIHPEEQGTGIVLYVMGGFAEAYPPGMPVGGSGVLSDAMARCIEHHGGEIRLNSEVTRVIVEGGRAKGVELKSGEKIMATDAVVAQFHPIVLDRYVEGLDGGLVEGARSVQLNRFSGIKVDLALNSSPDYHVGDEVKKAFFIEPLPETLLQLRQGFDTLRYGTLPEDPSMVVVVGTDHDPTRAPDGKAVCYIWQNMPYELADGGAKKWDTIKDQVGDWVVDEFAKYTTNMGPENIIARSIQTPLDHERYSLSYLRGEVMGCGSYFFQSMGHRPTPELSQYAVPGIDGLYLAGPAMHPGGGINGGGRAVAIKLMEDLNIDFDSVVSGKKVVEAA